jgi:DNA-binding MarR family transcriptional regulator
VRTHILFPRYDERMTNAADWREDEGILAWSAFLRAHAAVVRRIEAEVEAKARLPLGWYDVLLELNAAPGRRMRMQELGEAAVLSRSRVSRIVDELVAAGLAERQPNPEDRRSSFAVITGAGRTTLRRAAPIYLAAVGEHFVAGLSPGQLAAVRSAMEALLAR